MPNLGATELALVLCVLLLLFGAKRLPDTARGLAKSLRILRTEVHAADTDESVTTQREAA